MLKDNGIKYGTGLKWNFHSYYFYFKKKKKIM